jgi:hypothetical protein
MKKFVIILVCFLCVILGYFYIRIKLISPPAKLHYHAGFLVYVDGKIQDFSAGKYMNIDFCSAPHTVETPQEIQIGKAHLHDNVGDVVHVHRAGAVWGDLFTNIHYTFPVGKPITGYVNGYAVPDILTYPIRSYDSIIIIVGKSSGVDLTKMVSKSHILDVERHSESCSV